MEEFGETSNSSGSCNRMAGTRCTIRSRSDEATIRFIPALLTIIGLTFGIVPNALCQSGVHFTADQLITQSLTTFERGENADAKETKIALYHQALELAERAVRLNPANADAHYATFVSHGRLLVLEGVGANMVHAATLRRSLDRALMLNPNHVGALVGRGSLERELPRWLGGDLHQSEADFRRALALDPQSVDARLGLIRTYVKAGRIADAQRLFGDPAAMRLRLKTSEQRREVQSVLQLVADSDELSMPTLPAAD